MNRAKKTLTSKGKVLGLLFGFVAVVALILGFTVFNPFNSNSTTNQVAETTTQQPLNKNQNIVLVKRKKSIWLIVLLN